MLKKIILIFLKIAISSVFILLIVYYNSILIALQTNPKVQFALYQLLSFLLVILFFIYPFINKKDFNKILWILFILWILYMRFSPDIKFAFAKDVCLDTNYCTQGLKLNTKYGLIQITKENCLKYGWKWCEKTKTCKIKK